LKEDRRVEEMKILIEGHMIARPQVVKHRTMKESPGTTVKLLPCNHDMRSWVKSWKQPLVEMQEKAMYIRPKVVGPFPGPYATGSYMHWAVLFFGGRLIFYANSAYVV
jgi:hypothetical protein